MSWFYISPTQERLPFSEAEVPVLVRSGVLQAKTQVWQAEQEGWKAASEVQPGWFRAASSDSPIVPGTPLRETAAPLLKHRAWYVVTGVFLVAFAVVAGVGCIASFAVGGTLERVIAATLLPCGILWGTGGVGIVRALGGVARSVDLGQPSVFQDALSALGTATKQIALGLLLSLALGVIWVALSMAMWGRLSGPLTA